MADFRWDEQGIAELQVKAHEAVEDIADQVALDARRMAPVDTGLLKSRIAAQDMVRGPGFASTVRVYARTPYAVFVEMGTRAHIIRAKNARVLANVETGEVFGPIVHHPGTRPQPYLRPALFRRRSR